MADASSASMFSGFITSGNAGAAVYGVTYTMETVEESVRCEYIELTSGVSPFQATTMAPGDCGLQLAAKKPRDSRLAESSNS